MTLVVRDEIPKLRALRDTFDVADQEAAKIVDPAKAALLAGIEDAFASNEPDARIARSVDYSREYVSRLRRKWKAKQATKDQED